MRTNFYAKKRGVTRTDLFTFLGFNAIKRGMSKKAWSGRFSEQESPLMERFNASIPYDQRLIEEDILGSKAHAKMLGKIGVLSNAEVTKIHKGLDQVLIEYKSGKLTFTLDQEDIHMAVEQRLTKLIGPVGGKLHSARSRNDQVATDVRLFVRNQTQIVLKNLRLLQKAFLAQAKKNTSTILPGYTHLQRAQPVYLAHHLLAYIEMIERDVDRFRGNLGRISECPLGAGALAGSPIKIDRKHTAKSLGFDGPTNNSLDTVSDRDFVIDFISASSVLMMHLSRFSEELVLWSSQEFGFVTLPQGFCTGSSMMPQKVNPDAPELVRGKTGRVYGNLMALLTTLKALPLAYNKDMQEDKEPLFDTVDTVQMCLEVMTQLLKGSKFKADAMQKATKEGFLIATDIADYLVGKNVPFRKAHEIVGQLVQYAVQNSTVLENMSLDEYHKHSKVFEEDLLEVLSVFHSANARISIGGTAQKQVVHQIKRVETLLKKRPY